MKHLKLSVLALTLALLANALAQPAAGTSQPAPRRAESELIQVLKSTTTQKEKADACRELAIVGGRSSVPVLAGFLADDSMSHWARYALQNMPGSEVDRTLRETLPSLQGQSLVGVIHTLGERKDAKATKALAGYLAHSDAGVARAAALSLGRIGDPDSARTMLSQMKSATPSQRLWLAEGVLRCADSLLQKGKEKPARDMFDALYQLDMPHQVKTAALRGSVLARGDKGPAFLATYLNSDNFPEFASALRIARSIQSFDMSETLLKAMDKASGDRLLLLMQTVGSRRDKTAVLPLARRLQDSDMAVVKGSLAALAQIGEPDSASVLAGMVLHTNAEVRSVSREALGSLPGTKADEEVLKMTDRSENEAKIAALDLIVRRRMTQALPRVLDMARSQDEGVRLAAVRRAGELAGPNGGPDMLKLLLQAKEDAELAAAEQGLSASLLKSPNRDEAASLVAGAWSVANEEQKKALLNVLSSIGGPKALEAVRKAIEGQDPGIRAAAIRALGAWNSPEAAPDLLKLAQNSTESVERVLSLRSYLGLVDEPGLKPDAKLEMVKEAAKLVKSPEEIKLLLSTLGGISTLPSLQMVRPYLKQAEVKEEAASAVLRISEKMLQARNIDKAAEPIDNALQEVAATTANQSIKDRALKLQEVGKAKAAAK